MGRQNGGRAGDRLKARAETELYGEAIRVQRDFEGQEGARGGSGCGESGDEARRDWALARHIVCSLEGDKADISLIGPSLPIRTTKVDTARSALAGDRGGLTWS